MSTTLVRKSQIRPLNIIRSDINTTTSGSALITKVIAGTGLTLSSTGVNSGTGDVTITLTPATASVLGGVKIGSGLTVGIDGTISVTPVTVTWGTITGTLSNQTDLQNALDAKYNNPTGTTADYIDGTGAIQAFPLTLPTEFISHEVKSSNHINKGQAVYVSDADGTNMIVDLASNNAETTSSKTMGLIDRTVNPNDLARVVTEGLLDGLDTSAAQPGDPVWLGVNGDLLFGLGNKPVAPRHLVFIGIVTRVQQNNGEIFVKVQNGYEFNEIHNYLEDGLQNNYVIAYESSTSLYKPKSIATLLGYTPADNGGVVHTTGNETIAGIKTFSSTTQSTSTGTGAVVIGGGLGVAKNLYVGGDFFLSGNLTIGGTTTTVNAQNLSVSDNMIYLNNGIQTTITNAVGNGSTVVYTTQEAHNYVIGMVVTTSGITPSAYNLSNQTITAVTTNSFTVANSATGTYSSGGTGRAKSAANPDLGFAGGYNDGTYGHAGLFRDATDNVWKFFKGYTPEPDASPYIDTAHASFAYADLRVAAMTATSFVKVGGTSAQFLKADGSVDTNTYLTSFTETDPTVPAHVKSITTTEKSNWNTAYSWGNHAVQGYATTTYVDTQVGTRLPLAGGTMTGNINWAQTDRGLTWGMNTDGAYIKFFNTGDGDADSRLEYATSDNGDEYHRWVISGVERMNLRTEGLNVNGIIYSSGYGNSTEWNTAYSWGNHAGLYASTTHTHTFASLTSKPTTIAGYGITDAITTSNIGSQSVSYSNYTGYIVSLDTRAAVSTPQTYDTRVRFDFKQNTTNGLSDGGTYNGVMYWRKYGSTTDWTGGGAIEIAYTDNGNLWHRYGTGTSWGSWRRVWNGNDFSSTNISNWNTAFGWGNHASVGYLTSATIGSYAWTSSNDGSGSGLDADLLDGLHASSFLRSDAANNYSGNVFKITMPAGAVGSDTSGDINTLQIFQPTSNRDAYQTFHVSGDYAVHFGVDGATNDLFVGGWSAGAVKNKIWHAGNITPVPTARTITINGTTYDLSADRSWTIAASGGVTSLAAGTGVSVSASTGAVTVSIGQSVATSASPTFDQVISTNNGNGTNFRIGDDAWIGDINIANTFRVTGLQDATKGYIVFGNSDTTALGRSGTGALTYGGNTIYHAGNLTNLNQLTNGPGYITSAALVDYWNINSPDPVTVQSTDVVFQAVNVTFQNDVVVQGHFTETSSLRYKENIVDLGSISEKVATLRPVRYNKIGSSIEEIGLIAEEVAEVFPEFVNYNSKGEAESLNYTRLSVVLLQTVKELSDKINKLETK